MALQQFTLLNYFLKRQYIALNLYLKILKFLKKNIKEYKNIKAFNFGLGSKTGSFEVYFSSDGGVDAYHYGYSHQGESDGKIFHDMLQGNEREKSGVPFLKFLFDYTIIRNKIYPIEIYFPICMKIFIDFPVHPRFKFYD